MAVVLFMLFSVSISGNSISMERSNCVTYAYWSANLEASHYGPYETWQEAEEAVNFYYDSCKDANGNIGLPDFW